MPEKDEREIFVNHKRILGHLVYDGFVAAYHSHEMLFKDYTEREKFIPITLGYLTEAHSYFVNAKTLYESKPEIYGEYEEISSVLHQFFVFNDELMTNIRTNHSHQWSDIEFRALANAFKDVSGLLSIDMDNYWSDKALDDN